MKRPAVTFAAALLATTGAAAATFTDVIDPSTGLTYIKIVGEIVVGDSDRFSYAIATAKSQVTMVSLNSPGGLISESLNLAGTINKFNMASIVPKNGVCASSCFTLFAAGHEKFVSASARVGVHNASSMNNDGGSAASATLIMAQFYRQIGVPNSIIGEMASTPANEVTWLTPADFTDMGAQIVPVGQAAAPAPAPLYQAPAASAAASALDLWEKNAAVQRSLSAEQNDGTPNTRRIDRAGGKYFIMFSFTSLLTNQYVENFVDHAADGSIVNKYYCIYGATDLAFKTCIGVFGDVTNYRKVGSRWVRS